MSLATHLDIYRAFDSSRKFGGAANLEVEVVRPPTVSEGEMIEEEIEGGDSMICLAGPCHTSILITYKLGYWWKITASKVFPIVSQDL